MPRMFLTTALIGIAAALVTLGCGPDPVAGPDGNPADAGPDGSVGSVGVVYDTRPEVPDDRLNACLESGDCLMWTPVDGEGPQEDAGAPDGGDVEADAGEGDAGSVCANPRHTHRKGKGHEKARGRGHDG